MKRSLQEVVELVVFGLIALLVGTGVLWGLGWLLGIVGIVFKFIAGLIWMLLRFIIPIALVLGVIYFIVRVINNQSKKVAHKPTASTSPVAPSLTTTSDSSQNHEPVNHHHADQEALQEVHAEPAEASSVAEDDTSGFKEMDDLAEKLEEEGERKSDSEA